MENNIDYTTVSVKGLTVDQQKIHNNNINPNNSKPLQDVFTREQVNSVPSIIHGIKFSALDRGDLLLGEIQGKDAFQTRDVIDPKYLDAIYKIDNNKLMVSLDHKNFLPVPPINVVFNDNSLNQNNLVNQAKSLVSDIIHSHIDSIITNEKLKMLENSLSKLEPESKNTFLDTYDSVITNEIPKLSAVSANKLENIINDITSIISNSNSTHINVKNQNYLQDQIKFLGFGEELNEVLKQQLSKGQEKFKIEFPVQKDNQIAEYSLNFAKGSKDDMYFFNSFDLKLQKSDSTELNHNFQVNGTKGVTAKEALNILDGRSVKAVIEFSKAGEKEVFIQLDRNHIPKEGEENKLKLKYFGPEYGIDTKSIIENPKFQLPNENYKEDAIKSLEKGNFVKVQFTMDSKKMDGLVSLNAQFKNVDFYDLDQNKLNSKYIANTEIKSKGIEDSPELTNNTNIKR